LIPTAILRQARSGFGLSRGTVRVLSTRFGKVCLAHRGYDGTRTQLRLVREQPDSVTRLTSESAWLTHLAQTHRLAVPLPQRWIDGSLLSPAIVARDGTIWRAAAFSWVLGRHLNRGLDAHEMRRAGALIAHLHLANRDAQPSIAAARPTWWIPRLFELATTLRDVVHSTSAAHLALSPPLVHDIRVAHDALVSAHALLPVGPDVAGLIHTDAHWQNMRFNEQRVGIVDFEDVANGRFMLDIACLWGKVEERIDSRRLLDAILEGYDRVSPLPAGHQRDLHVMLAFRRFDYAGWVLSWPRRDLHAWGPTLLANLRAYIERQLAL
jgi:Ser/Thr protein kinase RdoA (MazF antagonist)